MFHFVFVQRDRLKLVNSSNPLVSMKTSLELNKTRTSCLRNRLGSKRVWQHGGPQKFFQGGGNVDISLIFFQIANDAMQMDLHKMLYPFYTASP